MDQTIHWTDVEWGHGEGIAAVVILLIGALCIRVQMWLRKRNRSQ